MLWHAVMAAHVLPTYPTGFLPGRKPECVPPNSQQLRFCWQRGFRKP